MHLEIKSAPPDRKLLKHKKCYLVYFSYAERFRSGKESSLNLGKVGFNNARKVVANLKKWRTRSFSF